MQLLFYLVYYHSTCFGHGSCPSSGVIHKTVKAATSVCQCVWGEVVYVESGYNVVRVSMRIVLRIGPPSYTILVRSCVSLCCCCTVVCGLRKPIRFSKSKKCRSQWPRHLRRRTTVACILRSWVRIPPGTWMSVCFECCVLCSWRSLRAANHSSREVLPSVVDRCVWPRKSLHHE